MSDNSDTATSFATALVAGGFAGTSVDVALFPIDTLKTRMQAPQGFVKAGGFRGIYNGLGAAAVGSAPGAALFFSTYEVSSSRAECRVQINNIPRRRLYVLYFLNFKGSYPRFSLYSINIVLNELF